MVGFLVILRAVRPPPPPPHHHITTGQPWSCCPRSALKRALSTLEARYGLTVVAGFELEFVLLKPAPLDLFKAFPEAAADANVLLSGGQAWVPLDSSIYCQAGAMTASATMGEWLYECACVCMRTHVKVESAKAVPQHGAQCRWQEVAAI